MVPQKTPKTVSETRAKWSQYGAVSETRGLPCGSTFKLPSSCERLQDKLEFIPKHLGRYFLFLTSFIVENSNYHLPLVHIISNGSMPSYDI